MKISISKKLKIPDIKIQRLKNIKLPGWKFKLKINIEKIRIFSKISNFWDKKSQGPKIQIIKFLVFGWFLYSLSSK